MSEQVEDKAALLSCSVSCVSWNKQLISALRGESKLKTFLLYNLLGAKSFFAFKFPSRLVATEMLIVPGVKPTEVLKNAT